MRRRRVSLLLKAVLGMSLLVNAGLAFPFVRWMFQSVAAIEHVRGASAGDGMLRKWHLVGGGLLAHAFSGDAGVDDAVVCIRTFNDFLTLTRTQEGPGRLRFVLQNGPVEMEWERSGEQGDFGLKIRHGGAVLDLSKVKETLAVGSVWAWQTSGTVLRLSAQRALALLE